MEQFLIVADLDSIQDYVFGTTRLPTIRGASALVEVFGERVQQAVGSELPDCSSLRHQGGQVVLVYRGTDPLDVERWLRSEARRLSGGALTATTAHHAYRDPDDFKTVLSAVFSKVQSQKESNSRHNVRAAPPASGGYVRHCDLCRRLPAIPGSRGRVVWQPGGDEAENRHLCAACWKRLENAREGRLDRRVAGEMARPGCLFANARVRFPDDLAALWPDEQEGRYLAMITADGDGIGRLLADIPEQGLYSRFSKRFDELIVESIADAACNAGIAAERYRAGSEDVVPLMPIVSGGDDFSVLLRPQKALDFAYELCAAFARATESDPVVQEVLQKCAPEMSRLTLSVGLAITKPHFPFSILRRLAAELRDNAKRQRQVDGQGSVDFALISSSGVDRLQELRERYSGEYVTQPYCLTQRPYALADLSALLALKEELDRVPRSQRKFLYTALWQGPASAAPAYQRVFRRNGKSVQKILSENFGVADEGSIPAPFAEDGASGLWQTPLLDALELIDL